MNLNPVILAIPIYFVLMAIELVYERFSSKKTYRLNDSVTNINLGALDQVTGVFGKLITIGIYTVVFELFAVFTIPNGWLSFVILFLAYDFCYYWSHRFAHQISLFWGGHVVHHQSEEFNLSVALRQSATSFIWSFPFYLPLALLGFSPVQLVFVGGLNLLYQFWIHTEHIDRLGPLERIMNTPSHHRVHHGRNPKYIDKNYAGVFIIWDRMFGTFVSEEERPDYGITKPLNSWNPLYANVSHYLDLARSVPKARSFSDKMRMLFYKPGWQPDYLDGYATPFELGNGHQKYDENVRSKAHWYLLVQFLLSLGPIAYFLFQFSDLQPPMKAFLAVWIVATMVLFSFFFESKRNWVVVFETFRLGAVPLAIFLFFSGPYLLTSSVIYVVLSLIGLFYVWRESNSTLLQA
jgi:alkylglycerol monooxygenase